MERLEEAKKLMELLKKYIYLSEKIQNEVVHADTCMLFREIEVKVKKQAETFIQTLKWTTENLLLRNHVKRY